MTEITKMLDLDAFVPDTKTIKLAGVVHAMHEMTVNEYIAKVQASKDAKSTELSLDEQIAKTVEMIHESFPTIPVETLRAMSLQMLTAVLDFVIKPPEAIAAEVASAQGNA